MQVVWGKGGGGSDRLLFSKDYRVAGREGHLYEQPLTPNMPWGLQWRAKGYLQDGGHRQDQEWKEICRMTIGQLWGEKN